MCKKINKQITSFLLASACILTTLGCSGAHYRMGEERAPQPIEKNTSHQLSHLVTEKVSTQPMIISKEGHQIEFLDDQLEKVRIQDNLPYPFSRELILPVYKESSALSLKDILMHGSEWHKNNLHVQPPTSSKKSFLYIGSIGLLGGGGGNSKCQYGPDEAEWDPKRGRWMCPALNHPRNEPRRVMREREAARKEEEEQKRKQAEESKKREAERLHREAEQEISYSHRKLESEAVNKEMKAQMEVVKNKETQRLTTYDEEQVRLNEQAIKEQEKKLALLYRMAEKERITREEEESLREKKLDEQVTIVKNLTHQQNKKLIQEVMLAREQQQVVQQEERRLLEERWRNEKAERKTKDERAMMELQATINHQQESRRLQNEIVKEAQVEKDLSEKLQAVTLEIKQEQDELAKQQTRGAHITELKQRIATLIRQKEVMEKFYEMVSLRTQQDKLKEDLDEMILFELEKLEA